MGLDLDRINAELRHAAPEAIVRWALARGLPAIASSSMGPGAGVMLHLVSRLAPSLPVIWVDTGYNLPETYRTAEALRERLDLNLQVYTPALTAERRQALYGPIPGIEEQERHALFTRQVKLEPFERALAEHRPALWLTGIRREETAFRRALDVVTRDSRGLLKVAPLFHWRQEQVDAYLAEHGLPDSQRYFDPTKVHAGRECGLHSAA
ncbi:phosphoadenosine phosphosulfate reductase domain-containing protein [Pseudohaliea rubra]|uniref:Phosphoadenylyl-sulfate reductase (Thioredoxin) n=1 Tax=Pseudohaliea rubra DSM 19751 TaxID=1265313 RepID=A0A095WZ05_9GAMM|nr:phosphoadenosine phosphosulfate reductase family protein [Pseudohaliea rubra]KGE03874.1 Phosphoadenylyl-sulfate reductase (thioredoxin) [Pseudohaliea rubra DSM 19751]